ncbi:hypothetical protein DQ04_00481100 [Trypanosoma grayi]|uniref:hypothetical protein n=1 Tax=Trypanosoma grayi TaxID=71804 RepID=UPI0004F429A5|nr:hypothetical protein DQ04_00481100 [Trypanosoma grayi]KEG14415.1 hypothetical protein DQ04_00481100 [Trypanosoma grayi]
MRRGFHHAAAAIKVLGTACCSPLRHSTGSGDGGGRRAVEVTPPPPRPAFYVPPEERDPNDASLAFLRRGVQAKASGSNNATVDTDEVQLGKGQSFAPELHSHPPRVPHYMDETSANLASTSVHAGRSLLAEEYEDTTTSRLAVLRNTPRRSKKSGDVAKGTLPVSGPGSSIFESWDRIEGAEGEKTAAGFAGGRDVGSANSDRTGEGSVPQKKPLLERLEVDLRRLEYYQGTPQYSQILEEFRAKYGSTSNGSDAERGAGADQRLYSQEETQSGLESQPIDYLRASTKLKVELASGPRAYDPVVVMQQLGVMRYQGYAFPPTTELGSLRDRDGKVILSSSEGNMIGGHLHKNVSSAMKTQLGGSQDNSLIYRTLGLDAVQRRQVRAMLSDFDYSDRHTAFHVMMSYPYTDWLHVLYMVLIGVALYTLQVHCNAYGFYDEYLGLDLRQVPRLKKPFLALVTVVFMSVVLFRPLLVASIATTRLYRIAMKRPIGPP